MDKGESMPIDYRRRHNEMVEQERQAYHQRKREENDDYREAYEYLEKMQRDMAERMNFVVSGTPLGQEHDNEPLRQVPDVDVDQLKAVPDDILNDPLAFCILAAFFLSPEQMKKNLQRSRIISEIMAADMEFEKRKYPISGWEC